VRSVRFFDADGAPAISVLDSDRGEVWAPRLIGKARVPANGASLLWNEECLTE
jgi:hypothetical protein